MATHCDEPKEDLLEMAEVRGPRTAGSLEDNTTVENDRMSIPSTTDDDGAESVPRHPGPSHGLMYGLEDTPPWYTTILLGLQHFMTCFGSDVSNVFILAPYFCISHDAVLMGEVIGTLFVVSGLVSVLQTSFGVRLPIIQGPTFAFVVPTMAILSLRGDCPQEPTNNSTVEEIGEAKDEWLTRMREIQGAIMVGSCLQVLIGATGLVGILLNFIGPLTIAPTITLIGLSLHKSAATSAGKHWGVSFMTVALITIFSQYIPEIGVPMLSYNSQKKCHVTRFKLFKLFPIVLGVAISWLFCFTLTATGVFPDDPDAYGYAARTDLNNMALEEAAWFRFPYPGQWGTPTVTMSSVLGIMAGVLVSTIESIGDYYACARLTGAPPPPQHAINRGIMTEGIGCVLSGAWGSGNGLTSYGQNIGAIGLTKVGSRVVVQAAGCIMIATGLVGKVGALLVTLPEPVVGGVLCVTFGMVTAVGLSNLQFVDLNSSRNLFVVGVSTLMGLVVPYYLGENPDLLKTGSVELDQILTVMLTTGMFVGGFLGILLDNTIPGTDKERGLLAWRQHITSDVKEDNVEAKGKERRAEEDSARPAGMDEDNRQEANKISPATKPPSPACYDLPFGMRSIRRWGWCRYLPFSPTFEGFKLRRMKICKTNR